MFKNTTPGVQLETGKNIIHSEPGFVVSTESVAAAVEYFDKFGKVNCVHIAHLLTFARVKLKEKE